MMTPVIELQAMSVCLGGRTVLDQLTGSFGGYALGLLGPNGAGKSTLLNTLLGFYAPTKGSVQILGLDPHREPRKVRECVGYMPENDAFIASMTGVHFVRYMAELSGLPSKEALERAHELFLYVGLGEARYRKLEQYSIGMKQLVKLAIAMVHGPKVLLLDEPTNGLDPAARERMIRLIQEVIRSRKTRVIISSHLLHDVEQCCENVLILKQGRIRAYVDLEEQRQKNQKFLELDTSSMNEGFSSKVSHLGCELAVFPGNVGGYRVRVVLPKDIEVKILYELAAAHDILIRKMSYRRDSLEEIFLDAMQEDEGPLDRSLVYGDSSCSVTERRASSGR
jgi:ABC-2 type transport system ATP-binding protein